MNIDFKKGQGLVPVIIQDSQTLQVLMLGYMNEEAFQKTTLERKVTFFSRSKQRLWTKGETSENVLIVDDIRLDCDRDTLLIKVTPTGPVCHSGTTSCFGNQPAKGFIYALEKIIHARIDNDEPGSYTNQLYRKGINKIAQKVGEEAVEVVIEAKDNHLDLFKNESADLWYHFLILLKSKGLSLEDVEQVLQNRNRKKNP